MFAQRDTGKFAISVVMFLACLVIGQDNFGVNKVSQLFDFWGRCYCVANYNNHVFAFTKTGLRVVDLSDHEQPTEICNLAEFEEINKFFQVDSLLYFPDRTRNGITVLNVSDPHAPQIEAVIPIQNVTSLYVRDTLAVVGQSVNRGGGFHLLDISDPANPIDLSFFDIGMYPDEIVVSGEYAYMIFDDAGLSIFDLSNINHPIQISQVWIQDNMRSMTLENEVLYLACGSSGLKVIDVSNNERPVQVGEYLLDEIVYDVVVAEDVAYVKTRESLITFDAEDPYDLQMIESFDFILESGNISLTGDNLFINGSSGLLWADISDPGDPILVNRIGQFGKIKKFASDGDYAVMFGENVYEQFQGFWIVDVGDANNPTVVGVLNDTLSNYTGISNILAQDGFAYFFPSISDSLRMFVIDYRNPFEPEIYKGAPFSSEHSRGLKIKQNEIFVPYSLTGIYVVDVSTPTEPALVDSINLFQDRYMFLEDFYLQDDYLSARMDYGLTFWDINRRDNPELISFVDIDKSFSMIGFDNRLYIVHVCPDRAGFLLSIYDLSNQREPVLICQRHFYHDIDRGFVSLMVDNNYLRMLVPYSGLLVYDIRDEEKIELVGRVNSDVPLYPYDANEDYVYLSDGYSLGIYDCSEGLEEKSDADNSVPIAFSLSSPFPNPFNSTTTIGYSLPAAGNVSLAVYDLSGREVARLTDGVKAAGTHEAVWVADGVSSGVYVVKLDAGRKTLVSKVVLVR